MLFVGVVLQIEEVGLTAAEQIVLFPGVGVGVADSCAQDTNILDRRMGATK